MVCTASAPETLMEPPNEKQLCFVRFLSGAPIREMPAAARSSRSQLSTCCLRLFMQKKKKNQEGKIKREAPLLRLCLMFVNICYESGSSASFGSAATPLSPLQDCHMSGCRPTAIKTNKPFGKSIKLSTSQANMHRRRLSSRHIAAGNHRNFSPQIEFCRERPPRPGLFLVPIEFLCRLNWTLSLSPAWCNTP